MFIPKITSYDTKIIPSMYEDWWRITAIYEDKIFWEKEEKKQRKTTAIVSSEILFGNKDVDVVLTPVDCSTIDDNKIKLVGMDKRKIKYGILEVK